MSVSLRKKVRAASGLAEALRAIQTAGASGALIIKSDEAEGSIALVRGRITAAALSPTGERGVQALDKLADLAPVSLRYAKFYGMPPSGQGLNVPIEDFLRQLSALEQTEEEGDAQAQNLVVAEEPPALVDAPQEPVSEEPPEPPAASPVVAPPPATPAAPKPAPQVKTPASKPVSRRAKVASAIVVAVVGLGGMMFCAVMIPTLITSTAGGGTAEELAKKRLNESMHQMLASDIPQESGVLLPNRKRKPVPKNADGTEARADDLITEDLRFARVLVEKGKFAEAQPYYETYLKLFPNSIKPRMELINVYLATDQRANARLLCLRTLKKQLTSDEIGSVWQLLGQCQFD